MLLLILLMVDLTCTVKFEKACICQNILPYLHPQLTLRAQSTVATSVWYFPAMFIAQGEK